MSFKDIIGQQEAKEVLLRSIKENRVFSSYIFWGKEGIGKKFTALEFAKTINCLNCSDDLEACESCPSCLKINKLCSPDLSIIEPVKDTISINQIRELQCQVNLKPLESRKKFYIIDQADKMTREAENCLLKTIEEPPGEVIIILICPHPDYLLPTTVSRCQLLNFSALNLSNLKMAIFSKIQKKLDENRIELIGRLAEGSISKALKLIFQDEYLEKRDEIITLLSYIAPRKYDLQAFNQIKELLIGNTYQLEEVLEVMLFWYHDILLARDFSMHKYIFNIDKLSTIMEKTELYSIPLLRNIIEYLGQMREYVERNVNRQILADRLFLKLVGEDFE